MSSNAEDALACKLKPSRGFGKRHQPLAEMIETERTADVV
jgi:hypothetical protein